MKEVVDKIIKEEKDARLRVENTRREASTIVARGEEEARKLKEEAMAKTKDETKKIMEKAEADVRHEKEEMIKSAISQAKAVKEGKTEEIKEAARIAFQKVIG